MHKFILHGTVLHIQYHLDCVALVNGHQGNGCVSLWGFWYLSGQVPAEVISYYRFGNCAWLRLPSWTKLLIAKKSTLYILFRCRCLLVFVQYAGLRRDSKSNTLVIFEGLQGWVRWDHAQDASAFVLSSWWLVTTATSSILPSPLVSLGV